MPAERSGVAVHTEPGDGPPPTLDTPVADGPAVVSSMPKQRLPRYTLLIILSVVAHLPLYGSVRYFAGWAPAMGQHDGDEGGDVVRLHLSPPPKKPETPIPPDAQLVDTPAQEHIADAKPVETKLLSDKTTRTEKETRSEVSAPAEKKAGAVSQNPVKPKQPSTAQSPQSKSPEPTATPKPSDKVELASGGKPLPESDRGKFPKSVMAQDAPGTGGGTGLLLPSTSASAAVANLQALDTGELTSTDHLPGMDRGRQTVLNANQYRFADFFLRVKQQVEKHWRPSEAYLRRDPTGQAYGVKDRYTILRVELDRGGRIAELVTAKQSGLDFMDEEAKRAFRAAHPFLNPPADLLDEDGRIRFEFGFYFEITGGKYRFNWKRL